MKQDMVELAKKIVNHFNKSELRGLCYDLKINYENIPGVTLNDMVRELVEYCRRHDQIDELISHCQNLRPNAFTPNWVQKFIDNEDIATFIEVTQDKATLTIHCVNQRITKPDECRIYLDGELFSTMNHGETKSFEIISGEHQLHVGYSKKGDYSAEVYAPDRLFLSNKIIRNFSSRKTFIFRCEWRGILGFRNLVLEEQNLDNQ